MPVLPSAYEAAVEYISQSNRVEDLAMRIEGSEQTLAAQAALQEGLWRQAMVAWYGLVLRLRFRQSPEIVPHEIRNELTCARDIANVVLNTGLDDIGTLGLSV